MFTWYAAVLASFVVAIPLLIKTARAAIESVDKNIIQASYALGHSEFQTTVYIVLPLAIYTSAGSGDWSKANIMVISLTALSGIALYLANKYSKGV